MLRIMATVALSVIIILSFFLEISIPGFVQSFSLSSGEVLQKPWTLVTHIFLHDPANYSHIVYNLFGLVIFGIVLESIIGTRRFLMIFFASGIAAGLIGTLFYGSLLGASGAIFGIMGTLAILRPKDIVWTLGIPVPMIIALILWILMDFIGFYVPDQVAHASHLAGLGVGIVYGLMLRKIYGSHYQRNHKILSETEMRNWENEWMK
jgi:membrane associated rhomboid family serine protease